MYVQRGHEKAKRTQNTELILSSNVDSNIPVLSAMRSVSFTFFTSVIILLLILVTLPDTSN